MKNLTNQTIEFMKKGFEGINFDTEPTNDKFYMKDIVLKTIMVIDGQYPSWGGCPCDLDRRELKILLKKLGKIKI